MTIYIPTPDPNKPKINWINYSTEVTTPILSKETVKMAHCPTCNTELPENHPALALQQLLTWVETNGGWEGAVELLFLGKTLRFSNGSSIEVVAYKATYDSGDIDVEGYYGESALPQGSEFEGHIIFKIGDIFYKKTGRGDSYGDVDWDGDIKQVEAVQKTVWEFK